MTRQYQKFPSFIADVSSLLEELYIIFVIFVNFFERKGIEKHLIKEMLKYNGSDKYNVPYLKSVFNLNRQRYTKNNEI